MYIYYFMNTFGFSIFELDIPFHYFFVYSFAVYGAAVEENFGALLFVSAAMALYLAISSNILNVLGISRSIFRYRYTKYFRPEHLDTKIIATILCVLLTALLLISIHQLASGAAKKRAAVLRVSDPPRLILLEEATNESIKEYSEKAETVKLAYFLDQMGEGRDMLRYQVKLVFADAKRYFLLLMEDEKYGVTISIDKQYIVFIGGEV